MRAVLPLLVLAPAAFPTMAGLNIPWNQFGNDLGKGSFDAGWFTTYFSQAASNNQNIARFWVHCDGRALNYASDGSVAGLPAGFTTDLQQLVSIAQQHSVVVQLCLWSFDMCKDETSQGHTRAGLVSSEAASRSYVDNALKPMLAALKGYPNVVVEAVNEPEWCMKGPGNTQDQVDASAMQRFVSMIAEAAHAAGRKATVGSASLKWSSHASESEASYWDDASLRQAYPSSSGGLDFYNVHYYDWMFDPTWGYDPMRANTAHWQLDKPTVVAELPASSQHYSVDQMLTDATTNGFKGFMFWAYNDPQFPVQQALQPLKAYAQSSGVSYQALLQWLKSGDDTVVV